MTQDTTLEANQAIAPVKDTLREVVFGAIVLYGGLTDEECQALLQMPPNTQRPRRRELVQAERVRDSGARRTTKSGRKAIVWEKAPTLADLLQQPGCAREASDA